MSEARRALIALVALVSILGVPIGSATADETAADGRTEMVNKAFDAVVLRPLDAVGLFCGAGLMIPAAALGLVGGMEPVQDAWDLLVLSSWESLVDRPLGHWGS